MGFQDHFAKLARQYARYRPQYPISLYARLAGLAPAHTLAWDCATGNGQAAAGLAGFFRRVVASDASAGQLAQARPDLRVCYLAASAEHVPLAAQLVDLVTVAQAVHWFDLEAFYAEVRRVLRPGGILAVWGYHFAETTLEIDRAVREFYFDVVGAYWPPQLRLLEEGYRSLPFPFRLAAFPEFVLETEWDLEQYLGFVSSWSAVQRFREAIGVSPMPEFERKLMEAWKGDPREKRAMRWPLFGKIGRLLQG
jgi:SAM-dependent methyltransferase